jgi:hypothetical protein
LPRKTLEIITVGISRAEMLHLHGDTGTGKTGCLEALMKVPDNWRALCEMVGIRYLPLRIFPIEMVNFETPGELHLRRAIKNGTTYDEESSLVRAIRGGLGCKGSHYPAVWLREIGRVHSAAIQGGLLNLISRGAIPLPDGTLASGAGLAWLADSNYSSAETATHTLVTQDDALARRWTISLPFNYLSQEEEARIIHQLIESEQLPEIEEDLIVKGVYLGNEIREQRAQGELLSLAPPSLYGYFSYLRLAAALPHMPIQDVVEATLLGAAAPSDRDKALSLFSNAFGIRIESSNKTLTGGDLI